MNGSIRGHREALCTKALNFVPRKHTNLCTLKSQIFSGTLNTPEPPMGGRGARVSSPFMCLLFAPLSRDATVQVEK